jgi:hypothetical protein
MVSAVVVAIAFSCCVYGGEPATLGSGFADVYGAFAPLSVLYRSYADYLFYGTDVAVSENLEAACDETGYLMATLHLDLLVQTGADVVAVMPRLGRLRADLAVFCDTHSLILATISALEFPDLTVLKQTSELGVFSDIYHLQEGLQSVFEAYLDGLGDEQDIWEFGAAFSLRTFLSQAVVEEIEPSLRAILYGSEGAVNPPMFVPEEICSVIEQLMMLVDVPLDGASLDEARRLAWLIYEYVIGRP